VDDLKWEYQSAAHGRWHDLRGHLPVLYAAAADRHAPVVIEAGVRRGMSTRAFLAGCSASGGEVWSVDLAPADVPPAVRSHPRWRFLQADDLSSEAQAWLPAACDVLFLDAHDDGWSFAQLREHVLAELRAYVPRVRPGGVVLLHDTQWEPPAVDLGEPRGGVAAALDAWCGESGMSWENRPGFYGLGIMPVA
jgi:predicted O-methyltransferase YrrM